MSLLFITVSVFAFGTFVDGFAEDFVDAFADDFIDDFAVRSTVGFAGGCALGFAVASLRLAGALGALEDFEGPKDCAI